MTTCVYEEVMAGAEKRAKSLGCLISGDGSLSFHVELRHFWESVSLFSVANRSQWSSFRNRCFQNDVGVDIG